jgi:hypothetical protein
VKLHCTHSVTHSGRSDDLISLVPSLMTAVSDFGPAVVTDSGVLGDRSCLVAKCSPMSRLGRQSLWMITALPQKWIPGGTCGHFSRYPTWTWPRFALKRANFGFPTVRSQCRSGGALSAYCNRRFPTAALMTGTAVEG